MLFLLTLPVAKSGKSLLKDEGICRKHSPTGVPILLPDSSKTSTPCTFTSFPWWFCPFPWSKPWLLHPWSGKIQFYQCIWGAFSCLWILQLHTSLLKYLLYPSPTQSLFCWWPQNFLHGFSGLKSSSLGITKLQCIQIISSITDDKKYWKLWSLRVKMSGGVIFFF